MDLFDVLSLLGGLCLFLFGMNVMGDALERSAGSKLEMILAKLTTNKFAGFLTGLAVTGVIQSSSATTVMVVGFVNSGIMQLNQAIGVIMGANIGTTVTAWILSLGGLEGSSFILKLLKPDSFTPVLALIGIIFTMFSKSNKRKDIGTILLGFAVLMQGMSTMSDAVSGLKDVPEFRNILLMFENPVLGVLAGAVLTAIIQSSSASVGILQALSATGAVTMGAAVPIIMGQNIGTCITALLSSFGTNRNAKRTAMVHLSFNVIGTVVWLTVFTIVEAVFAPALFDEAATHASIATAHSLFNIACTSLLFPQTRLLEKLAYILVPETAAPSKITPLDERLLATPAVALERCHAVATEMADAAVEALNLGLNALTAYTPELHEKVRELEERTDRCEDMIGTYLVKLSSGQLTDEDSAEATRLLKIIGDLERIGDHALNLMESANEMQEKGISLTEVAGKELTILSNAITEILGHTRKAFVDHDGAAAAEVEPLEEVVDRLKDRFRTSHIKRLQQGKCTVEAGFVWNDILTDLERTSDHCSNIAASMTDGEHIHEAMRRHAAGFEQKYAVYAGKYLNESLTGVPPEQYFEEES